MRAARRGRERSDSPAAWPTIPDRAVGRPAAARTPSDYSGHPALLRHRRVPGGGGSHVDDHPRPGRRVSMETVLAFVIGGLYAAGIYLMLRRSLSQLIMGLSLLTHAANLLIFTVGGLTPG